MRWVFLCLALVLLLSEQALAQSRADYPKFSLKSEPTKDGVQRLEITLTMEKGVFLPANPVGNADLEHVCTRVWIEPSALVDYSVHYPKGKVFKTDLIRFDIYETSVTIPVEIRRGPKTPDRLELNVFVSPQADGSRV